MSDAAYLPRCPRPKTSTVTTPMTINKCQMVQASFSGTGSGMSSPAFGSADRRFGADSRGLCDSEFRNAHWTRLAVVAKPIITWDLVAACQRVQSRT